MLEKTLGVPLFQEQVMRLAVVAADYTPGEADQLRRDMAAWRRTGRIERHRERLVTRMQAKGIALEFAERVFQQITGFGEYGFPESHAASFALISYAACVSLVPLPRGVRLCALERTTDGLLLARDDHRRRQAARRAVLLPIDVRISGWDCTMVGRARADGTSLRQAARRERLGAHRNGTEPKLLSSRWRTSRSARGLDEKALTALAEAGAFRAFEATRRASLWKARGLSREDRDAFIAVPERRCLVR